MLPKSITRKLTRLLVIIDITGFVLLKVVQKTRLKILESEVAQETSKEFKEGHKDLTEFQTISKLLISS